MEFRLCPVRGLEVENDDIGEVLAVLVLSTEDKKFTAMPETCGVPHPYPWDIAVVIYEVPLPRYQVETKYMIVN
jgi:hypothetical protein